MGVWRVLWRQTSCRLHWKTMGRVPWFLPPKKSLNLKQTWGKRYCHNVSSECLYSNDQKSVVGCQTGPTGLISVSSYDTYRNWDCVVCNSLSDGIVSSARCGPTLFHFTPSGKRSPLFYFIIHASSLSIPQFKYLPDPIHNQTSRIYLLENVTFKDILKRYARSFSSTRTSRTVVVYLYLMGQRVFTWWLGS
jgi:hypothetical protein